MLGALKLLEMAVPAIIGIVLGWVAATLYADVTSIPAARQEGVTSERIVWQERQQREAAKRETERAAAQAEIDRIEADYHQREAERSAQMTALDQALQEEQANAPIPVPGAPCRAVVSRRVLDGLRGVGSSTPRVPAAVPAARVP